MRQTYILGMFIKSCAGMRVYGINIIDVIESQPWYQSHVIAKSQAKLLTSTSSIGFHLSNQSLTMLTCIEMQGSDKYLPNTIPCFSIGFSIFSYMEDGSQTLKLPHKMPGAL